MSPATIHLSHGLDGRLHFGGNFSVPGFLLVVNQMAVLIAPVIALVGSLVGAPPSKQQELVTVAQELEGAASGLTVDTYQSFFEQFRAEQTKELVQQELEQRGDEEFQSLSRSVIDQLVAAGELPADLGDVPPAELQEKVFMQIYTELSRQVLEKVHQQDSAWLTQSASTALVEAVLERAEVIRRGCEAQPDINGTA